MNPLSPVNPLSLCQLTVETGTSMGASVGDNLLATITAAAKAGFSAVVPRIRPASGPGVVARDDQPLDVKAIRRRLDDTGLAVVSALSYWITAETDPTAFRASMDAAAEIGSAGVQIVCHDPDEARLAENFAATSALAEARGLKVALEFMAYTTVNSLGAARRLIARSGARNAGLCLDALHFYRAGGHAADLASLEPQELFLVQICDAALQAPPLEALRQEARGGRFYPGEGALPLDEFFAALPPGCLLDVEAPCAADAVLPIDAKAANAARATRAFLARQQSG